MKRITIDADLQKTFRYFIEPLELCDESGQVVARIIPSTPWNDPENWKWIGSDFSEEELKRRIDSNEPTFTTQEIIEKIKEL